MKNGLLQIQKHFYEGSFSEVCELFATHEILQKNSTLQHYYVGALTFTGQLQKALAIYKTGQLSDTTNIACRFYLALGNIRQSQYQDGKALLIENLRELRKPCSDTDRFYIYQGIAFFRFFCGRFSLAKKYADLSFQSAIQANFTFGEILSRDLLAHSLVHLGQVRLGLRYFEETIQIAKRVKNEWMGPAMQIAALKFKAQVGFNAQTDLSDLQEALDKIKTRDIYSTAELLLELVRQYILRGAFSKAEETLSQASEVIYKNQNRRQIALLNLRMSYVLFLQGQYTQSLHIIRFAEQNIDIHIDLNLWTQICGLKLQLLETLSRTSEAQQLRQQLLQKSHRSQTAIHQKMMVRTSLKKQKHNFAFGEDPIGDLLDKIHTGDPKAATLILQSGYYGLLHKCYKLPFGTQSLIFDLIPNSVVILARGNVVLKKKGVNSLLRKIILHIKDRPMSKEDLVNEIWGYEYDPSRHDPLIYSAMNKVRKLLEPHGDWIGLNEEGYHIQKAVKVIIKNTLKQNLQNKPLPSLSATKKIKVKPQLASKYKDLNIRQLQVLDYLKKNHSISILELSSKLDISKPTATRDLSKLYSLRILKRAGKGRATRYFL